MVRYPPIGAITSLPLCGEFIVVQLNPAAMVKHLEHPNASKLVEEYSELPLYTYLAIIRRYLETPSEKKPWHMCELFIMHQVELAGHGLKMPSLHKANVSPAEVPGRSKSKRNTYMWQNIYARIRTRIFPLPRDAPYTVPDDAWVQMKDQLLVRGDKLRSLPMVCKNGFLRRAEDPETQPATIRSQDGGNFEMKCEWDEAHRPGICLLPHFDYSFNILTDIAQGKQWEEEHIYIMKRLVALVPSFPRIAKIPIRPVEFQGRELYLEHPKSVDSQQAVVNRLEKPPVNGEGIDKPAITRASEHIVNFLDGWAHAFKRLKRPVTEYRIVEKAYEYKVERPVDSIWVKLPTILMVHGEDEPKPDKFPLNQPIRRQSIIPQGPTTEFIDEKFYIPFVDEVAVDINLSKNLETKPMGSS